MPPFLQSMKKLSTKLKSSTARKFEGGLNVVDSELNLSSKFARIQDNMYRGLDGAVQVRQGCKLVVDVKDLSPWPLINGTYFFGYIISVNSAGEVFATAADGTTSRVWDAVIANARRFGLKTWSKTDFVSFEQFSGLLVISNGVDKPLSITSSIIVDYLADPSTGSNFNTPIGAIMRKFNQQLVIASGPLLNVSDWKTCQAWTGDAGATFAAVFDMSTSVTSGSTDIIGLSSFRNYLLVHFAECTVPVQFTRNLTTNVLDISDASDFGGVLAEYGAVSSRTIQNLGDESLACDIVGVQAIKLEQYTQILSPDRPSRLVDPLIKKSLTNLNTKTLNDSVFSMWDRLESMYMLFMPDTKRENQRETRGYGYTYVDNLNINAWNTFSGWNWAWSARSSEGLVFFGRANDTAIFVKGDEQKLPLYADFIGDQEVYSDGTTHTDQTGFTPVSDIDTSGVPIKFQWDLPWADMKKRSIQKTIRYLLLDTQGSATFTVKMFIDGKYIDKSDEGEEFTDNTVFTDDTGFIRDTLSPALTPALQMDLVGGDYGGYGAEAYGDIYGGGRNTSFARLFQFPTKFNIFKLRFEGETMRPLNIVGISPVYIDGSIRRNSDF
jgi:hypothetical protein